jgi:hypothetical protein
MSNGVLTTIRLAALVALAAFALPRECPAQDQPDPQAVQPQCLLSLLGETLWDELVSWLSDLETAAQPLPGEDEGVPGPPSEVIPGGPVPALTVGFPAYAEATEDFEGGIGPAVFNNVACQGYKFTNLVDEATRRSRSFEYVSDPVRHGEASLRFEVRDGDGVADGDDERKERCELLCLERGLSEPGDDTVYGFSIFIPADFPNPNDFNYFTQFLRDPNSPNAHVNPTYGLFISPSGRLRVWYRETVSPAPAGQWQEYELIKGRWVDYELRIAWRTDESGRCEVYQDGELLHVWNGQNLYPGNADTHWKIGMYRGHDIQATASAIYDRAYFARSWPAPPTSRILLDAVNEALAAPIDALRDGID